MRGYDAWVTREPPYFDESEVEPLRCECGKFLPKQATERRETTAYRWCDGKPSVFEDEHDESVLAIIGEEHRGKTFKRAYAPPCNTKDGGTDIAQGDSEEIHPEQASEWEHEPHWVEDPWGQATVYVRRCSCGRRVEEIVN